MSLPFIGNSDSDHITRIVKSDHDFKTQAEIW